jgi:organic hydroperoxide reductase OsmC/OhrA
MSIVKSHRYPVSVRWLEGRLTELTATGRPDLEVATPPEFKGGIPGVWSPEDLFVGSVASCYTVTLLALAERAGIELESLEVDGVGHLERMADGRLGFVSIELLVRVEVDPEYAGPAEREARRAKDVCLIGIAVETPIQLELEVVSPTPAFA